MTANTYRALAGAAISLTLARWVAIDLIGDRLASSNEVSHRLILNPTLGIGALCVGSLWAMALLSCRRATVRSQTGSQLVSGAIVLGMAAMCVGLSLEIERAVARVVGSGTTFVWPAEQVMHFGWTSLWAIAAAALPWIGRAMRQGRQASEELKAVSTLLVSAVAAKFLAIDCVRFALLQREADAGVLVNAQMMVAALLLALLIIGSRSTSHRAVRNVARSAIFLLPLVVGSIEINRVLGPQRTLVGFSVYWGLYAMGSIAVGFLLRSAVLRFAGLGLLGITLLKVVFVDLANAGTGWRILSFLGLGIILLATSVLYGRLSPKLLEKFAESKDA